MATGPITTWQIEGEDMEAVTDFTFLGSIITTGKTLALIMQTFVEVCHHFPPKKCLLILWLLSPSA